MGSDSIKNTALKMGFTYFFIHFSVFTEHLLVRLSNLFKEAVNAVSLISITAGCLKVMILDFCRC